MFERDECEGCGIGLPEMPWHGSQGRAYCSTYCRTWVEGEPEPDRDAAYDRMIDRMLEDEA